jgi:hypothetical protein
MGNFVYFKIPDCILKYNINGQEINIRSHGFLILMIDFELSTKIKTEDDTVRYYNLKSVGVIEHIIRNYKYDYYDYFKLLLEINMNTNDNLAIFNLKREKIIKTTNIENVFMKHVIDYYLSRYQNYLQNNSLPFYNETPVSLKY